MRITFLITVFYAFTSIALYSQNVNLEEGMKNGFDTFTKGKTFEEWIKGAKIMNELGQKYPNEWLPNYWASYLYTQLTFNIPKDNPPKGITSKSIVDEAQKNLDLALQKVNDMRPDIRSDFHALQTLIYDFRQWTNKDENIKAEFLDKRQFEIKQAIMLNSNSPLVDVIIGTDLIKRRDLTSVYAGRILLLHAKKKYDERLVPRYMSSHWNEQWINHWLSQSVKGIEALTKSK